MDQVSIKYTIIKIYPNLNIWFENKPSGNPGLQSHLQPAWPDEFEKKSPKM
jgi:hypothetical protein